MIAPGEVLADVLPAAAVAACGGATLPRLWRWLLAGHASPGAGAEVAASQEGPAAAEGPSAPAYGSGPRLPAVPAPRPGVRPPVWLIVPAAALLWTAMALHVAPVSLVALGWALAAVALLAAAVDLVHGVIPNRLNAAAAVIWLPIGLWSGRWLGGLEGCLAFGGLLLVLAVVRPDGMGMGDVKFAAVLGLYLGWRLALAAFVVAAVVGAAAGLVLLAWKLKRPRDTIPFGPCLACGALFAYLAGPVLLRGFTGT